MKTATWEDYEIFASPAGADKIRLEERPFELPAGVEELMRERWGRKLEEQRLRMLSEGVETVISPYGESALNALHKGSRAIAWPGPAVSLMGIRKRRNDADNIILLAGATNYTSFFVLGDRQTRDYYTSHGIALPTPPLATCVFPVTMDNQIALTVRGNTDRYARCRYGIGGNIPFVNTNITDHVVEELQEELHVHPFIEYSPGNISFAGIISDMDQVYMQPVLAGWVPLNMDSAALQERFRSMPREKRTEDAAGIAFAPAQSGPLFDYLVKRTHPLDYCGSAHGGLVLFGMHSAGEGWASDLLKRLEGL